MPMPEVSVIIINWNTRDLLAACLRSVYQTTRDLNLEIIVVDNNSKDDSCEMVRREYPLVRLIENSENVGFTRANNQAARAAQGQYIFLLNSDAELQTDSLQKMLALMKNESKACIVGARLLNPDGSFQASHTPFPTLWREFLILTGLGRAFYRQWFPSRGPELAKGSQPVDYVEGAAMLIRRDVYLQHNGLDESYFMYAEEVDLCYRIHKAGWQVWYHPEACILHHGGGSSLNRRTQREGDLYRSRVRFFRKHYGNRAASLLKLQIYILTAVKLVIHKFLRLFNLERYSRPVIPLRELSGQLKGV
jgi:N-acetylglucosaminyl-diphospho-decaprenol L-rhamnosyltransferase